jgi:hypothetical protein
MADWNKPALTDSYANFLTFLAARDTDAALMFNGTSPTNTPTGAIGQATVSSNMKFQKYNGTTWVDQALDVTGGGTGGTTAATARTGLGLGTMSTQASSAVSITGGAISGVTVAGSTGAFTGMLSGQSVAMIDGTNSIYLRQVSSVNRLDSFNYPASATLDFVLNALTTTMQVAGANVGVFNATGLDTLPGYKQHASDSSVAVDRGYGYMGVTLSGTTGLKAAFSVVNSGRFSAQIGMDCSNGDLLIGQTGVLTLQKDSWHLSSDAVQRIYFANGAQTYYQSGNSYHVFRTAASADFFTLMPQASGVSVLLGTLSATKMAMNGITTLTDGATVTMNQADNNIFQVTIAGNRTFVISGTPTAGTYILKIVQGTGGSRLMTWPVGWVWMNGGTAPTLSTAAGKVDIVTLFCDGTNIYATFTGA